jgi:TrpR family trp operon transcriptional repressor
MRNDDPRVNLNICELAKLFAECSDEKLLMQVLRELFTPAEIVDLAGRWALLKALSQNKSQRSISKEYGISLCKITRGAKELKKEDSALKKFVMRLDELNQHIKH